MRSHTYFRCACLVMLLLMLVGCDVFNSEPTADFFWAPTNPLARLEVQFTDMSHDSGGMLSEGGVIGWFWEFGDGGESHEQNPSHVYEISGAYTVKLTVQDEELADDTAHKTITITPSLEGIWIGRIVDPYGFELDMELQIAHQPDGSFAGIIVIAGEQHAMTAGNFNPTLREVALESKGFNILLAGLLNANEVVLTGVWFDLTTGQRGAEWIVFRQDPTL